MLEHVKNHHIVQAGSVDQILKINLQNKYISLVTLTTDHALSFFNQYQQTGIQEMTDLPRFAVVSDVYDWIKEEDKIKNSYNYAIELPVVGFAGLVNLVVSEHAAFFAIWLGEKFQGLGLGTTAGRLICEHAINAGLDVIFSAAFVTNHRSIKMLKKIGFETLPISAYAPHDNRVFFMLTTDLEIKKNCNSELINYYQREELPHKFYSN